MELYDFNILTDHEKYDTVFTVGEFVDSLKEGRINYALYSISKFWVEVMYDVPTNKILEIGSFVGGKTLDRYSNVPNKF